MQPFVDGGNEDGGLVADCELVVPRGHGPVSFEAVDAALDRVPSLVVLRVELRRPSAARAARILPLVSLQLLQRTSVRDSQNLQNLMRSAVRSWESHVCMLVSERDEHVATGAWRWSVEGGRLWLRLPRQRVRISQNRKDLTVADDYPGPTLIDLRERARRFEVPLTSIRLRVADRIIGYDGPGDDVAQDSRLDGISRALGQEGEVIEAGVKTSSGVGLRCIFSERVASARAARSQIPLHELIGTTVQLMHELSDREAEQLARLLGPVTGQVDAPWDQPPLFEQ